MFKNRSLAVAIFCGLAALALGLFAEWRFFPFVEPNDGFGFFLAHFYELKPLTLIMVAVGAFIGFWCPFRRIEKLPTTN
jgi:hypothetical protein